MVSTGHKGDVFKKVTVRRVFVMNEGGEVVVARGVKDDGTEKYEKRPLSCGAQVGDLIDD